MNLIIFLLATCGFGGLTLTTIKLTLEWMDTHRAETRKNWAEFVTVAATACAVILLLAGLWISVLIEITSKG